MTKILHPMKNEIFQINDDDTCDIVMAGKVTFHKNYGIRARYNKSNTTNSIAENNEWIELESKITTKRFYSILKLENASQLGFIDLEIQIFKENKIIINKIIQNVGIGHVILALGQSNSANHGNAKSSCKSELVYMKNKKSWEHCKDPMPLATGEGGSPWVPMADAIEEKIKLPLGIISIGYGGSSVSQWLPKQDYHKRLVNALNYAKITGLKTILWHQGETDASKAESYKNYKEKLTQLINLSWEQYGVKIPWIIAKAAFLPDNKPENNENIVKAQTDICNGKTILEGPTTEDLTGEGWRYDLVHFNKEGLQEHGNRWAKVLLNTIFNGKSIPN